MRDPDRYRSELYPPLAAHRTGMLPLDAIHTIYWEESGNPNGVPLLYLHGGPGGGSNPRARQFFDPSHYRIVLFDQRGAGRSTPLGEARENSTAHLVADIERLRKHLNVEHWMVFGGSWGATLALAYGEAHPERCLGFVLRGVFLGTRSEIDWFLYGMRRIFPEAWRELTAQVPRQYHDDLANWFHGKLFDPDPAVHLPLAQAWSRYEGACSALLTSRSSLAHFEDDRVALGIARLESHYFVHDCFLAENELQDGLDAIRHLPCEIIQGRYDMICPLATAESLHHAWYGSTFSVIPDAGHSAWEPGVSAALVRACEKMKRVV